MTSEDWTFVTPTPDAWDFIRALADTSLTTEQRTRLMRDHRLTRPCAACTHPGYMHENAERQYETGAYGVPEFEAGDLPCEAADCDSWNPDFSVNCGWYEGDNWRTK